MYQHQGQRTIRLRTPALKEEYKLESLVSLQTRLVKHTTSVQKTQPQCVTEPVHIYIYCGLLLVQDTMILISKVEEWENNFRFFTLQVQIMKVYLTSSLRAKWGCMLEVRWPYLALRTPFPGSIKFSIASTGLGGLQRKPLSQSIVLIG